MEHRHCDAERSEEEAIQGREAHPLDCFVAARLAKTPKD